MITDTPLEKNPLFPASSCYTASIFYAYNQLCNHESINDFLFFIGNTTPQYRELDIDFYMKHSIPSYAYSPLFFGYEDDFGNMIQDFNHDKRLYLSVIAEHFQRNFNIKICILPHLESGRDLVQLINSSLEQNQYLIINTNEFYNTMSPMYGNPSLREGVAHCLLVVGINEIGVEVVDSRCFFE